MTHCKIHAVWALYKITKVQCAYQYCSVSERQLKQVSFCHSSEWMSATSQNFVSRAADCSCTEQLAQKHLWHLYVHLSICILIRQLLSIDTHTTNKISKKQAVHMSMNGHTCHKSNCVTHLTRMLYSWTTQSVEFESRLCVILMLSYCVLLFL